eukprot:GHVS01002209.1.p1 GENE.GHVS01002209.1~~GHVS01002209.1.p1  ORF type:complete len:144 (-),score=20.02 GHVS01002209.1:418-849(-)
MSIRLGAVQSSIFKLWKTEGEGLETALKTKLNDADNHIVLDAENDIQSQIIMYQLALSCESWCYASRERWNDAQELWMKGSVKKEDKINPPSSKAATPSLRLDSDKKRDEFIEIPTVTLNSVSAPSGVAIVACRPTIWVACHF